MNRLNNFDSSYFIRKSHFDEDFKVNAITNTDYVSSWKSKGLSTESIKPPITSDNSLTPELNYYGTRARVKFTGSCLKQ